MAHINPAPVQLIGDASVLDSERLEELNSIAEDYGKIMFVDEVIRDANELTVVGYEDTKANIKKPAKKPAATKTKVQKTKETTPEMDKTEYTDAEESSYISEVEEEAKANEDREVDPLF